jgi:hypothetical protein
MSKQKRQLYAVIRVDQFGDPAVSREDRLPDWISVKEIVSSLEAAQAEVGKIKRAEWSKRFKIFLADDQIDFRRWLRGRNLKALQRTRNKIDSETPMLIARR